MTKKNHKHEHQPDQQPSAQPTTPATPLELSEEELQQITGGADFNPQPDPPGMPAATGPGGLPELTFN